MNILFIHASNIVAPASSGIIRVTATLKGIFEEHGHKCFNAYYKEVEGGKPLFAESLKLVSGTDGQQLVQACQKWKLDAIICQIHPTDETERLMRAVRNSEVLTKRPMLIECMHNNPYIEVLGYTPHYLWYLLKESKFSLPSRVKKALWGVFCCYMPDKARRKVAARYQKIFDLTDKVVLLSDKFIPEMKKYQRYKEGQLQFANNPMTYDDASFTADDLKKKEKLVVYVGRLEESQKRLSVSLAIWKRIEQDPRFADWRFDIVGTGGDEEYHKRIAKDLKLKRVTFWGTQNPNEWYGKASILMLTSAYEGWGMVINEAQQKGVVPIAYGSYASILDLITDGVDGCIVPNQDKQAFVDTLKMLMTDEEKRRDMQLAGLKNSGRYSEDVIYRQWEKILLS